jgi:hypothetical protein
MVDVNTQEKPQEDFYSRLSGPLTEAIGPIADPMTRLLREKDKTTQTELEQKTAREAAGATKKAAAARTFYDTQKQEFKKYDTLPERPKDTITQDTQQGLQGLAMLLPVAGMFLGAVGNTSGVNAMNAMTGILKGYKEGNDQRIAFETKKYESAIKEWEANYKKAKEGIDRAIEIAKTNYQAGVAEAEAAARKIGSVELAAMVRSKSLGEIQTMMNKVGQDFQTAKNKAETLAARPQRPIIVQDEEGKPMYANPSTGEPILGPDGKPLRPAPTGRATTQTGATSETVSTNAQAIANYSMAPPGRNNRNRDQIMAQVMAVNPEYKEGDYGNQNIALRNWTNPNGAGFKQIGAFSTVAGHLDTLNKLAAALDNGDTPAINAMVNYIKRQTGDATVTNYDTAKQAVASELVKAVTGVAGALADREEAAKNMLRNGSPEQQEEAIRTWKDLIASRLETSMYQFKSGTGRSENEFLQLLPPATREYFAGYAGVRPAARTETPRAPSATSGTTPLTAQPAYLNGREIIVKNGRWVFKDTGEEAR